MITLPSMSKCPTGLTRGAPDFAPVVCSSSKVEFCQGPPTLPPLTRNSAMTSELNEVSGSSAITLSLLGCWGTRFHCAEFLNACLLLCWVASSVGKTGGGVR